MKLATLKCFETVSLNSNLELLDTCGMSYIRQSVVWTPGLIDIFIIFSLFLVQCVCLCVGGCLGMCLCVCLS